jgi:hypothetical protein
MKMNPMRAIYWVIGLGLWSLTLAAPPEKAAAPTASGPTSRTDICPAKLDGFYGFAATGVVPLKQADGKIHSASLQELGQVQYKPDLTAALRTKVVINGSILTKTYTGKYSVDTKTCAGSVKWTDSSNEGFTWGFVVVSGGSEIDTMDARGEGARDSPASAIVFTQKKI